MHYPKAEGYRLSHNKFGFGSHLPENPCYYTVAIDPLKKNGSNDYLKLFETSRYRNLVLLIRNQSKSVNHTCGQNMTSAKKQPYVNPRIRGISGDDEKEVLRKLQLLCRYDSEKRLQTNGKKQLGRHYKN
ncbi:unnamed protein product [Schistosoma intercalatum]|nr:unnamed protein product [Schistosoma intercalatum]CAH8537384.1 unnamed protein product [Schistosoma intercalatum]